MAGRTFHVIGKTVTICIGTKISQIATGKEVGLESDVFGGKHTMRKPGRNKGEGHKGHNKQRERVHFSHHRGLNIALISPLAQLCSSQCYDVSQRQEARAFHFDPA
jgi:hypothetical protein